MLVTTTDTNKTYSISLRIWTGKAYTPDLANDLFAADVVNGVNESYIDQLQEDVTAFNAGKTISWFEHSLYAPFLHCLYVPCMRLDVQEVTE